MRNFANIGRINGFIKDSNKKSLFRIIKEILVLIKVKKEIPFYYFKYLYRKDVKNYLEYLSRGELMTIGHSRLLHKPAYKPLLDNKLFFALLGEKSSLNIPKLWSYNLGNTFYFGDATQQVCTKNEMVNYFEHVFKEGKLEGLFFRPPSDYGGKGCFKLTRANLKNELDDVFTMLTAGCYVHTEIIKQHKKINEIHDKSICTLRIISLVTPKDQPEIIGANMRFGVGESVVDNSSSGGFFVGINLDTGTLKKTGHYMVQYSTDTITKHPDSGFVFENFEIPYFKEACEEIFRSLKVISDRLIGWDIAITPYGPTIIEANRNPHLPSIEVAHGGLLQNQHVKNLMEELKKENS